MGFRHVKHQTFSGFGNSRSLNGNLINCNLIKCLHTPLLYYMPPIQAKLNNFSKFSVPIGDLNMTIQPSLDSSSPCPPPNPSPFLISLKSRIFWRTQHQSEKNYTFFSHSQKLDTHIDLALTDNTVIRPRSYTYPNFCKKKFSSKCAHKAFIEAIFCRLLCTTKRKNNLLHSKSNHGWSLYMASTKPRSALQERRKSPIFKPNCTN